MARRDGNKARKTGRLDCRVHPEVEKQVQQLAWERRIHKSELVRRAVQFALENPDETLATGE